MLLLISQNEGASTSYVLYSGYSYSENTVWYDDPHKRCAEIPALLNQSQARSPKSSIEVCRGFWSYLDRSGIITKPVGPERLSSTLVLTGFGEGRTGVLVPAVALPVTGVR
jgi:hypothetical protein